MSEETKLARGTGVQQSGTDFTNKPILLRRRYLGNRKVEEQPHRAFQLSSSCASWRWGQRVKGGNISSCVGAGAGAATGRGFSCRRGAVSAHTPRVHHVGRSCPISLTGKAYGRSGWAGSCHQCVPIRLTAFIKPCHWSLYFWPFWDHFLCPG